MADRDKTTEMVIKAIEHCKTHQCNECPDIDFEKEPSVGGWISVEDRLPEDEQDVLAYLNNGEETRIAPCNYYNGVWFDSVMNCVVVLQDVTHWMPLPEPPKEVSKDG